jgi:hypothetical protein
MAAVATPPFTKTTSLSGIQPPTAVKQREAAETFYLT